MLPVLPAVVSEHSGEFRTLHQQTNTHKPTTVVKCATHVKTLRVCPLRSQASVFVASFGTQTAVELDLIFRGSVVSLSSAKDEIEI